VDARPRAAVPESDARFARSEERAVKTPAPILITGATGFVGGHFAYRLLGLGHSLVAVVRGSNREEGRARLLRTLADVAGSYGEPALGADAEARLDVALGDVTRPQ